MNGSEFINRVRKIARERRILFRIDTKRAKGSHILIYYGARKTVIKDRRKELKTGLLSAMIRQPGLDRSDFR